LITTQARTKAGQVAMAIVVVELVSVTCLVVFFAIGGSFRHHQ
jgi:hypothetical protein